MAGEVSENQGIPEESATSVSGRTREFRAYERSEADREALSYAASEGITDPASLSGPDGFGEDLESRDDVQDGSEDEVAQLRRALSDSEESRLRELDRSADSRDSIIRLRERVRVQKERITQLEAREQELVVALSAKQAEFETYRRAATDMARSLLMAALLPNTTRVVRGEGSDE